MLVSKWRDQWALGLGVAAMVWKNLRPARRPPPPGHATGEPGISVVVPSRQGRHLLERMLGKVEADLASGEIIVVDNGSSDGTAEWLRATHPRVRLEAHPKPLSFARAANRGVQLAQHSRVCLLNNDMEIEPGFFPALEAAFAEDPDLFCASAQIFFPKGLKREETGKTAMHRTERLTAADYPVYCDEPLEGENYSPVLYGSGGCSLYDRAKFLALGGFDEFYAPAYVEDLDLGYRAWRRGWSSLYVAGARVLHRHRATSSRFFTAEELDRLLDRNHARFLLRSMESLEVFVPYYRHAMSRLPVTAAAEVFRAASGRRVRRARSEREILDLTGGAVRVFPGRALAGGRRVLLSAGSSEMEVPGGVQAHYLAYCRPRAIPPESLLDLCRAVIYVDGAAGEGSYRAALGEMQRRYSIEETVGV